MSVFLAITCQFFSDLFMQMLLEMERFFFKHILLKIIEKEEKDRGRDKTDI